jgi:zinc protease
MSNLTQKLVTFFKDEEGLTTVEYAIAGTLVGLAVVGAFTNLGTGDAALDVLSAVLADGKNSRLYKRLVYDTQMAQDVTAYQESAALGGAFRIVATARPGHTAAELKQAIDEEIARVQQDGPTAREVERARNQIEASFYRRMQRVGGFGGKADLLNDYYASGGGPDFFAEDLARYTALTPADVQSAAREWLPAERRVELVVELEAVP